MRVVANYGKLEKFEKENLREFQRIDKVIFSVKHHHTFLKFYLKSQEKYRHTFKGKENGRGHNSRQETSTTFFQ